MPTDLADFCNAMKVPMVFKQYPGGIKVSISVSMLDSMI
jgi:hypothetical protein